MLASEPMLDTAATLRPDAAVTPRAFRTDRLIKAWLWLVVIAPAVFLFLMVQHSAITVPFWDHCELGRLLVRIYDQGFQWRYLWAPENHTRPVTTRAILVLNAVLTRWDIRSEYIYLLASIYSAFILLYIALRRVTGESSSVRFLAALAILSVISFSPAGHNNHWWSLMLQYDLCHFFILAALISVALAPASWPANLLSLLACWLATYTFTTGLVAFVVAAAIAQFASPHPTRLTLRTAMWCSNIALALALYLPGLPPNGGSRPTLFSLVKFIIVYLGAPLADLIWFPFTSPFDLPSRIWFSALTGTALCGFVLYAAFRCRDCFQKNDAGSRLFLAFVLFALGSAVLIAWGRAAWDEHGVANAMASRYTIFSSYLLYALVYLFVSNRGKSSILFEQISSIGVRSRLAAAAFLLFILLAENAYSRSVVVYTHAHMFGQNLSQAFQVDASEEDKFIYPNPAIVTDLKRSLKRLRLGPYRDLPEQPSTAIIALAAQSAEDTFRINGIRVDPIAGTILFAHPRSTFVYPVSGEGSVTTGYGILDGALQAAHATDGVEFRILLQRPDSSQPDLLWSRYLDPGRHRSDIGAHSITLRLNAPAESKLLFETLPGRSPANDWAYWSRLQVTGFR